MGWWGRSDDRTHCLARSPVMMPRDHLLILESEAIHVLREVAAQFERPVLMFSGGKDSVVLSWLARKAFHPAASPFPLLHIDTGHNFPETLAFRRDGRGLRGGDDHRAVGGGGAGGVGPT